MSSPHSLGYMQLNAPKPEQHVGWKAAALALTVVGAIAAVVIPSTRHADAARKAYMGSPVVGACYDPLTKTTVAVRAADGPKALKTLSKTLVCGKF